MKVFEYRTDTGRLVWVAGAAQGQVDAHARALGLSSEMIPRQVHDEEYWNAIVEAALIKGGVDIVLHKACFNIGDDNAKDKTD